MQHCIPEDLNPLNHHNENLKLKIILTIKLGQKCMPLVQFPLSLCPVKVEDQLCSNVSVCVCISMCSSIHYFT